MNRSDASYETYLQILRRELIPAMGCTEPIALAYAAAKAREVLGKMPDRVLVLASGSIIKNINSVIVPNTGHLKGIPAAAAAGIAAGDAARELEVISGVKKEQIPKIREFLDTARFEVGMAEGDNIFDIVVTVWAGEDHATVRIADYHTNVVLIERNHEILWQKAAGEENESMEDNGERRGDECEAAPEPSRERESQGGEKGEAVPESDREKESQTGQKGEAAPEPGQGEMSVAGIWDFVNNVDLEEVKPLLERQISCNMAIAREGLQGNYGANIGKILLAMDGDNVRNKAKAMAAAASDARMNGCELPVIINSGSGNQGITVSVPVEVYARHLRVTEERKYRALLLSNLLAIHQKAGIGRLSAYCGAICAGAAAGAGIAYLHGGGYKEVCHTVVNALAVVSGMICDGAKSSCAAKIAVSIDAGIMGYFMYCQGQEFYGGDGIVAKGIENTLHNVGRLGRDGMKSTNEEIIRMMTE